MSEPPASRPYHSPRRAAQARETRLDILQAARKLFVANGYVATTMIDVAGAAGVAKKTVTTSFPTKRDLLMGVWDFALKGEDSQVPVAMSESYKQILEEPDPRRKLALVAANTRQVRERAGDVMAALAAAADADTEIGEQSRRMRGEFHANQGGIIESLAALGALRPELSVTEATDLLVALNNGNLFQTLVRQCGWSPDRFEEWHVATLQHHLLSAGPPPPRTER